MGRAGRPPRGGARPIRGRAGGRRAKLARAAAAASGIGCGQGELDFEVEPSCEAIRNRPLTGPDPPPPCLRPQRPVRGRRFQTTARGSGAVRGRRLAATGVSWTSRGSGAMRGRCLGTAWPHLPLMAPHPLELPWSSAELSSSLSPSCSPPDREPLPGTRRWYQIFHPGLVHACFPRYGHHPAPCSFSAIYQRPPSANGYLRGSEMQTRSDGFSCVLACSCAISAAKDFEGIQASALAVHHTRRLHSMGHREAREHLVTSIALAAKVLGFFFLSNDSAQIWISTFLNALIKKDELCLN